MSRLPSGSVGKESACSAGDAGDKDLIPGSGRSPGVGASIVLSRILLPQHFMQFLFPLE